MNVDPRNPPLAVDIRSSPLRVAVKPALRDCSRHIQSAHPSRCSWLVFSRKAPSSSKPDKQKNAIVTLTSLLQPSSLPSWFAVAVAYRFESLSWA